jgi:drug/metabolite transporter (DMT)-like permease
MGVMATPSPTEQTPHVVERRFYGMGLRLLSALFLAVMAAMIKINGDNGVGLIETLFYRQFFGLPVTFLMVVFGPGLASLRTRRLGLHISRTAIGMIGMFSMFGTLRLLPLTEATTLNFAAPIFATILATLFLGERPGLLRWGAVLTGFVGIVLLVNPQSETPLSSWGIALALCGAMVVAVLSILIRQMARTEATTTIVFWFTTLSLIPLSFAMIFNFAPHDNMTWLLIVISGLSGGLAQICLTGALRWAPISIVLPMDYSNILWATLFGWLLWQHWPDGNTWAGTALIITSGLFIAWREHVRHRAITAQISHP